MSFQSISTANLATILKEILRNDTKAAIESASISTFCIVDGPVGTFVIRNAAGYECDTFEATLSAAESKLKTFAQQQPGRTFTLSRVMAEATVPDPEPVFKRL